MAIGSLSERINDYDLSDQTSFELVENIEFADSTDTNDYENGFSENETDFITAESSLPLFPYTIYLPSKRIIAAAIPLLSYDIKVPPPKLSLI